MKKSIIIIEDFYDNPDEVRNHALNANWSKPEEWNEETLEWDPVPFWSSTDFDSKYLTDELMNKLTDILPIDIDWEHFHSNEAPNGVWNGSFQLKKQSPPGLTLCIHDHVDGLWNDCFDGGWSGIVFLTPDDLAIKNHGFSIYTNNKGLTSYNKREMRPEQFKHEAGWICDAVTQVYGEQAPAVSDNGEWDLFTRLQYKYNTAIFTSAELFHDGHLGWGDTKETGRLIQTLFIKRKNNNRTSVRKKIRTKPKFKRKLRK